MTRQSTDPDGKDLDQIHVAMCVDHGFAVPLAVALQSLDAISKPRNVIVHILHPGLSQEVTERVVKTTKNLELHWVLIDETVLSGVHHPDFLSNATLYRLLLGEILPASVHRLIYLDADTVVKRPLSELYEIELAENVLGAVRDAGTPWAAGPIGPAWRELGMSPSSPYFNAGVLVIDLDSWREQRVGGRCLELLKKIQPRWGDQDALNAVLEGRWHELPRRWNVQAPDVMGDSTSWALWRTDVEDAVTEPAVVHYSGRMKPWIYTTIKHPRNDEWFMFLDRTSWAGWRPLQPRQNRLKGLARKSLQSFQERGRRRVTRLPA